MNKNHNTMQCVVRVQRRCVVRKEEAQDFLFEENPVQCLQSIATYSYVYKLDGVIAGEPAAECAAGERCL